MTHHSQHGSATVFRLPSDREIVMERDFDAPRDLVFDSWSRPDLIPKWWGPRRYTTSVEQMDVRPGGRWRYLQHDAGGNEYGFHGESREIRAPERVVYTFEYEGMPGHVILETATWEEHDGKTKLTVTSLFNTMQDRDAMFETDMQEGASESQDRFAELLAELWQRIPC